MDFPIVERVLEQQGRTPSWLARKAGIDQAYAWRMLHGERPMTDAFKAAIADALGVPADVLFPVEPAEAAS